MNRRHLLATAALGLPLALIAPAQAKVAKPSRPAPVGVLTNRQHAALRTAIAHAAGCAGYPLTAVAGLERDAAHAFDAPTLARIPSDRFTDAMRHVARIKS